MTSTNQQMTSEQLDELMVVAVSMQRDAEKLDERPVAVFAYAVQLALAELQQAKQQLLELSVKLTNVESKCADVVAENGQMLRLLTDISENHDEYVNADEYLYAGVPMDYVSEINAYVSRDVNAENPFKATDAYLAEVRASAIEHAASERWGSGYVFDELNEFAAQLRQGAKHE